MKRLLLSLALGAALLPGLALAQSSPRRAGLYPQHVDPSVRPQDDFYRYVNGTWLKGDVIPADKSNHGAFSELDDKAQADLRALVEEAMHAPAKPPGSALQQLGDFFASYLDTARVEALGLQPVADELARVDAIATRDDLVRYLGYSQRTGGGGPFAFFVNQDAKDATRYIAYVNQGGLGLPDRDYYFADRFAPVRNAYRAYVTRLFELAGRPGGAAAAETVLALETRLAARHWTRVQNRDRNATYNKVDLAAARTLTPHVDWSAYFAEAGAPQVAELVVRQPSFFQALDSALTEVPVADWKTYLALRRLSAAAPLLGSAFATASFDFYDRTLSGVQEPEPRWKQAIGTMDALLGELMGRLYVERHFKPEAKARMNTLVENLRTAFAQSIDELAWMDAPTKAEAKTKLASFTFKIGYPDTWRDYSALVVRPDDLYGNVRRASALAYERMVGRLGQPVDRTEWAMTPQTVNAYYNPMMNEVVFPAAILQPPFFDLEADDAVNYGGIVSVIGHEFSHGFDDQGRKSDGQGNLRDWWTEASAQEFQRRAAQLVAQYDAFSPLDTLHVNGQFTLGENIGDLAGLAMAYRAYRLSLGGQEAPVLDGFTGDQRFFLGWAQVWRRKYRDDEMRRRLLTDPHAPSEYRANGILSNMPAFYEAFGVKEGDGMYRPEAERVKIW